MYLALRGHSLLTDVHVTSISRPGDDTSTASASSSSGGGKVTINYTEGRLQEHALDVRGYVTQTIHHEYKMKENLGTVTTKVAEVSTTVRLVRSFLF